MSIEVAGTAAAARADSPINKFYSKLKKYPGNNKQWWVAKAQADDNDKKIKQGDFLPEVLDKTYSGNTRAPRGHFILNAFRKDRAGVSGIYGAIPIDEKFYRPNATCYFSGRVWWAAADKVYYSQILVDTVKRAGHCYQEADPTSEDISDLIATDGGLIPIAEARNIQRLMPLSNGVMVFAENGLWFISGGQSAFSATDIVLDKVSAIGTSYPQTIIAVADSIFWWSEVGIHAIEQVSGQFGPIPGKFGNNNISEATIQSFYNRIPEVSKRKAKAIYDPKINVVQWVYSDNSSVNTYNCILSYDVTLQAFYPWKVSEHESPESPRIVGVILDVNQLVSSTSFWAETISGDIVTDNSLDNVEVLLYTIQAEDRPTNITYLTSVGSDLTFSQFTNRDFVDWETYDNVGLPYLSFMETGYELLEDAMRKKQAVRVFIHFRRTEDDSSNPQSSCKFRTKWEWTANRDTNKWSRQIEAYRPRQMRLPSSADFESGFPVVISNNKVRGSGKAVQFRFESDEPGKNFDLLGWSVAYVGNTEP